MKSTGVLEIKITERAINIAYRQSLSWLWPQPGLETSRTGSSSMMSTHPFLLHTVPGLKWVNRSRVFRCTSQALAQQSAQKACSGQCAKGQSKQAKETSSPLSIRCCCPANPVRRGPASTGQWCELSMCQVPTLAGTVTCMLAWQQWLNAQTQGTPVKGYNHPAHSSSH